MPADDTSPGVHAFKACSDVLHIWAKDPDYLTSIQQMTRANGPSAPTSGAEHPGPIFNQRGDPAVKRLLPLLVPKRRTKQLPPNFVPRHTRRLAKKRHAAPNGEVRQVQDNLMRRLGLAADLEVLGETHVLI
jgi:hypothetical protein